MCVYILCLFLYACTVYIQTVENALPEKLKTKQILMVNISMKLYIKIIGSANDAVICSFATSGAINYSYAIYIYVWACALHCSFSRSSYKLAHLIRAIKTDAHKFLEFEIKYYKLSARCVNEFMILEWISSHVSSARIYEMQAANELAKEFISLI